MKKLNTRAVALVIVVFLAASIVIMYLPSFQNRIVNNAEQSSDTTAGTGQTANSDIDQGSSVDINGKKDPGTSEQKKPQVELKGKGKGSIKLKNNTQSDGKAPEEKYVPPVADLNLALEKVGLTYKSRMYGAVKPNYDLTANNIAITNVDTFDTGEANGETLLIVPFYSGSEVRVEKVQFTGTSIVPVETVFTGTSTEDYALSLRAARPSVMPNYRVCITFKDVTYTYLLKGTGNSVEYFK